MRTLVVCNIMSLDGYVEGPGKNVMILPMDPAFDAYCAERLRAADTLLLRRTSFEAFKWFWRLLGTRTWDGSGNVLLRYGVSHPEA